MLVTIATTHAPATDLGYLLHKAPGKLHSVDVAFGRAHVFYTEARPERCCAAMLLEIDPVGLVRDRADEPLAAYVSDRPYVASSFLAVALARVFGTALSGRSRERAELADLSIPLECTVSPIHAPGGGASLVQRLFGPLGWEVTTDPVPIDPVLREAGASSEEGSGVMRLTLRGTARVEALLSHLYVLLPVLDGEKHYFVGEDEVDKLVRHGEGWLETHPERDLVTRRYLRHSPSLIESALEQLMLKLPPARDEVDPDDERAPTGEAALERPLSLDAVRRKFAIETARALEAKDVVDLGCGEGKLVAELARESWLSKITGVEVSNIALERAARKLERLPEHARRKITLLAGSLVYRDQRIAGADVATCLEVIEHIDPPRLPAFELALFAAMRPRAVVITTPNREHNVLFAGLPQGKLRHRDHRFEWTRAELDAWATGVAARRGYRVRFAPIGAVHPDHGPPTQAAIFERIDEPPENAS